MEKRPKPPANQVKDRTVMANMPKVNFIPKRSSSEKAPLQVAQTNPDEVSRLITIYGGDNIPLSGVYGWELYIPKM